MRRIGCFAATLALALAAGARPAAGQRRDTTTSALLAALREAEEANRLVRVRSLAGVEVEGRVQVYRDSSARVGTRRIDPRQQAAMEARFSQPDPVWDGMLVGAIITSPLVYGFAGAMSDTRLTKRQWFVSTAAGMGVGAMLGFFWDSALEPPASWLPVWSRK